LFLFIFKKKAPTIFWCYDVLIISLTVAWFLTDVENTPSFVVKARDRINCTTH